MAPLALLVSLSISSARGPLSPSAEMREGERDSPDENRAGGKQQGHYFNHRTKTRPLQDAHGYISLCDSENNDYESPPHQLT